MNQKTALYIALGLTTFILVAIGSVVLAWPTLQQSSTTDVQPVVQEIPTLPAEAQIQSEAVTQTTQPEMDTQSLLSTIEARDAAYQAQIEQANQQLNEAYQRLQELEAQNQLLLEREQIYQQRLQESAQIIEAMSTQPTASMATAYYEDDEHEDEHDDDDRYEEDHDDDDHDEKRDYDDEHEYHEEDDD